MKPRTIIHSCQYYSPYSMLRWTWFLKQGNVNLSDLTSFTATQAGHSLQQANHPFMRLSLTLLLLTSHLSIHRDFSIIAYHRESSKTLLSWGGGYTCKCIIPSRQAQAFPYRLFGPTPEDDVNVVDGIEVRDELS